MSLVEKFQCFKLFKFGRGFGLSGFGLSGGSFISHPRLHKIEFLGCVDRNMDQDVAIRQLQHTKTQTRMSN